MERRRGWGLVVIILMVCLALVRAERGVAELKGEPPRPSRLLRLTTSTAGQWEIAFLGMEARLFTRVVIWDGTMSTPIIRRALPVR